MSLSVRPRGSQARVNRAESFYIYIYICIFIPREARPKAERSEVTNRVAFGQTTWLASPSKSSREFLYMYLENSPKKVRALIG